MGATLGTGRTRRLPTHSPLFRTGLAATFGSASQSKTRCRLRGGQALGGSAEFPFKRWRRKGKRPGGGRAAGSELSSEAASRGVPAELAAPPKSGGKAQVRRPRLFRAQPGLTGLIGTGTRSAKDKRDNCSCRLPHKRMPSLPLDR